MAPGSFGRNGWKPLPAMQCWTHCRPWSRLALKSWSVHWLIAPCTGATLARLAAGLSDTPVTLAAKSLLRVGCPVLVGVSTNDGLGASGENIARLFQRKHYYFVPYGQDDPTHKPNSLKADFARLPAALDAALAGRQLQPVLLQNNV